MIYKYNIGFTVYNYYYLFGEVKQRPFTKQARGRPWEQRKLYSTTAAYLKNRQISRFVICVGLMWIILSINQKGAHTLPFFRLLKSSLFCMYFSISALTSIRRTLMTSSTVKAKLSTGWLNSSCAWENE